MRRLDGRLIIYLLLLAGLGLSVLPLGNTPGATIDFPNGYRVEGRFLSAWQGSYTYEDSVMINGFPLSDVHDEVSPTDGKTYKVQWFERARFEYHPDETAPNDIELSLLGVIATAGREAEPAFQPVPQPANAAPSVSWFPQTRHTVRDQFRDFWQKYGGAPRFGFPLSEQFADKIGPDGQPLTVQWFERARFELHTDADGKPLVGLGLLGAEQYKPAPPATATP